MGSEETCNTGLSLGLGSSYHRHHQMSKKRAHQFDHYQKQKLVSGFDRPHPSLSLSLSSEMNGQKLTMKIEAAEKPKGEIEASTDVYRQRQQASSMSAVSASFSNSSVKREREAIIGDELAEVEKLSFMIKNDDQDTRKKLRLTKEQSLILEDSFKEHSTLNPRQKQALAKQLNLQPRQVEVWFQNRRARTKLKQTEVDCEFLKKCCETLTDENTRLQKELQELKALKLTTAPFYLQLPAATLTICPSCERISGAGGEHQSSSNKAVPAAFTLGTTKTSTPHFFNPLNHPSAAC